MFWNKKCTNCSEKVKQEWAFCPMCGSDLKYPRNDQFFSSIDKEFQEMDKSIKIPKFMMKPLIGKGINIVITSQNGEQPRIEVVSSGRSHDNHVHHHHKKEDKPVRVAKFTEEPEASVKEFKDKQIVTLNLPDVKNLKDIEINQFSHSIEIRAFAGDKAYFKLIPIPSNATVNNEFKDGVLKIEVMK